MADRMTWSDDDLIDGRLRSGVREDRAGAAPRRFPLVAVMAGGIFAALLVGSGVTWLLLHGGEQSAQSSTPPLIKADEKPIKVYPESPGGMAVENTDKFVYSRLRGEPHKGDVERILPEPERPEKPNPEDLAVELPPATPSPGPGSQATAVPGESSSEAKIVPSAPIPLGSGPADVEDEPAEAPAEMAPPPTKPAPKAVASKPMEVATARPVPAQPASRPAERQTSLPAPVTAPTPATGKYQVQLLAARSAEDVSAAWKKIQAKNGDVLGGLGSTVARADLGDRGVFYRLRVGPIASEAKAKSLCSTLSRRNLSCLIIRPGT